MRTIVAILFVFFLSFNGCQDPQPYHAKEECAASCEARGGTFYLMDGEYCYCQWTDGDAE